MLEQDVRVGPLFVANQGQWKREDAPYMNSTWKSCARNTLPGSITQQLLRGPNQITMAVGELFPVHTVWVLHGPVVIIYGGEPRRHNPVELGAFLCGTMDNV